MANKSVQLVDMSCARSTSDLEVEVSSEDWGPSGTRKIGKSVATRVIEDNRSVSRKAVIYVVCAMLFTTISSLSIILTRQTHLGSNGVLMNNNHQVVAMTTTTRSLNFTQIISLPDPMDHLDKLTSFRLKMGTGIMSFKVAGWSMPDNNNIEIATLTGHTVVVDRSFTPAKIDVFNPIVCNYNITQAPLRRRNLRGSFDIGKYTDGQFRQKVVGAITAVTSYVTGMRTGPAEHEGNCTLDPSVPLDGGDSSETSIRG